MRQVLLLRFADGRFVESILRAVGSDRLVRVAVPKEWRGVLAEHGFDVSPISSFLFAGRLLRQLAAAIRGMFGVLGRGLTLSSRTPSRRARVAYFVGLVQDNLPPPGKVDPRSD